MAKRFEDHGLPDDTIYNILVRLPVKTLCRFKCTCNSWRSLISSPQFQTDHYCLAQKNPHLVVIDQSYDPFTLHCSIYNSNEGTLVKKFRRPVRYKGCALVPIQSCLGLVCITLIGHANESGVIIYNPSTNALLSLPPTQGLNFCVGFGYAYSTNEFKVVRFFLLEDPEPKFQCGVFSLGTHEWRAARSPPYYFNRGCAPFLHGAIHLLPSHFQNVQEQDHIAAFDIENEEYKVIRLPQFYYTMDKLRWSLTELGGSLCLSYLDRIREGEMELWLLKDYDNGEWIKGYTIQLSQLVDRVFLSAITARTLAIQGDGSILVSVDLMLDGQAHKLVCYDPMDRTITEMMGKHWSTTLCEDTFLPLELCNSMLAR